jgi:hypothetical protein
VKRRNALIDEAEKIADSKIKIVPDDGESNAAWTRAFSIAMDELAKPLLGLVERFKARAKGPLPAPDQAAWAVSDRPESELAILQCLNANWKQRVPIGLWVFMATVIGDRWHFFAGSSLPQGYSFNCFPRTSRFQIGHLSFQRKWRLGRMLFGWTKSSPDSAECSCFQSSSR